MKRLLFLVPVMLLAVIILMSYKISDKENYALAVPSQIDNIYVYYYSKPFYNHDTVFTISTVVLTNNPDRAIRSVIKKAKKVADEKQLPFDGIITGQGQLDYVIKFRK